MFGNSKWIDCSDQLPGIDPADMNDDCLNSVWVLIYGDELQDFGYFNYNSGMWETDSMTCIPAERVRMWSYIDWPPKYDGNIIYKT